MREWLRARRQELLWGIVTLMAYGGLFPLVFPILGKYYLPFGLLWVVLLSWGLGLGGALLVGFFAIPLHQWLFTSMGFAYNPSLINLLRLVDSVYLLTAVGVGTLRFYQDRLHSNQARVQTKRLETDRRLRELALLSEIRDSLTNSTNPGQLLALVIEAMGRQTNYDRVAAYRVEQGNLRLEASRGRLEDSFSDKQPALSDKQPALSDKHPVAWASRTGASVLSELAVDARFSAEDSPAKFMVVVPVALQGQMWAVLQLASLKSLDERDLRLLQDIAGHLALALEKTQVHTALKDQETLYQVLLETLPDAVVLTDGLHVLYLNPAGLRGLGYERLEEVVGQPISKLVSEASLPQVAERLQRTLAGERDTLQEIVLLDRHGKSRQVETIGTQVQLSGRRLVLVAVRDVEGRKRQEEHIAYLAYHDPLTELPNRRKLTEVAGELLVKDRRKGNQPALVFLDLDRFKIVNDTLGHAAGDELLRLVAARIQSKLRDGDLLVRLSGDEFAILLPNANRESALGAARRVLTVFEQPFMVQSQPIHVGGSLGIALYPEHGETLDALSRAADVAMYQAKNSRSGVMVYDPRHDHYSLEDLHMAQEIREAIGQGELALEFQPILNLRDMRWVKWETLVRWQHPLHGWILPMRFIPKAEETGLIGDLDLHVLRNAVKAHSRLSGGLTINLSASTLAHPNWVREVVRALVEEGIPPEDLWLEITESALLPERQKWLSGLEALRALGVRVALDDFGMGYSSLNYLRHVPVDLLKIDRTFIAEIGKSSAAEEIVLAIIRLSKALGLQTLAEGVESRTQLDWLVSVGCDLAQGFYVGRPMGLELAVEQYATQQRHLG
jgi:diguanylate cyclase (GGDEF)-like protein/PAS domain S-box-containing protein